jgi:DNA-binding transcriptional ArsR family regulator
METPQTSSNVFDELIDNFDFKLFKTLSEPVRLEILKYLMLNGRSDVGTIAEHVPQDRSVVSRHLNRMHESGILNCEKKTRHMYYEINGQAFVAKLEMFTAQVRKCMEKCCPSCCK